MVRGIYRLVCAVGGAASTSILVGLLETRAVVSAAEEGGQTAPSSLPLVLAELGVLLPVVFFVGAGVGAACLALEPGAPKTPAEHLAAIRNGPMITRLRAAAAAPLVVLAIFFWTLGSAHLARASMGDGKPVEVGLSLGVGSIAVMLASFGVAVALVPVVRRVLALGSASIPQLLDPLLTGGLALVFVGVLFGAGLAIGDTGGDGGVLGIFGVLKRGELDLRPVANLALIAGGAYFAQVALGRTRFVNPKGQLLPGPPMAAAGALGMVLALALLCAHASSALDGEPLVASGIEKHAPLGKMSLAALRKLTDRDHDGFSASFGGGDCNDSDPTINPGAIDVPGNGIDEDCSGADTPAPPPPPKIDPAIEAAKEKKHKAYNVVLFTVDTLRIDLGFMGYPRPVSPNLDKLAEGATVFERAYSMASYTGKSVGPFMIGKYPSETKRDGGHFNTYYPENTFVAERLKAAGVRTFAGHCHWYFRFPTGLNQGIDQWDTSAIPPGMGDNDTSITSEREADLALKLLGMPQNTSPGLAAPPGGAPPAASDSAGPAPSSVPSAASASPLDDAGVQMVDGGVVDGPGGQRHFFGWFHFFDPHAQYVPHEGAPDFSSGQAYPSKALYDGEVWFTDKNIGRVIDWIKEQPWADDTAILLTADHGEAFADHGMSWHGAELWESLVRVPLVIYLPGVAPRRVKVKRSHIDLVPTILDIMDVPRPEDPDELRGKSLLADVFAPPDAPPEERDVYIDMPAGPFNGVRRAIISGTTPGMKLISQGGAQYLLYDLDTDPKELKDLSGDRALVQEMVGKMNAIRSGLKEIEVKPDTQ